MRPRRVTGIFCATADSRRGGAAGLTSRRAQSPAKALQSAPLGPALVRRCSRQYQLVNTQLYTRFPAHLRRCCGKKRLGASILSSKVLTVLRALPRRERLITRPGIPSWTSACGFLQPLPAATSVQSAVVRPRRTAVKRATRRHRKRPRPLVELTRYPSGLYSLFHSSQTVRANPVVVYIERRLWDHSAPSGPKFEPKRLLDCKRACQPR